MAYKFLIHIYGHQDMAKAGLELGSESTWLQYTRKYYGYHILNDGSMENDCEAPDSNLIILQYWSTFSRNDGIPKHSDLASRIISKIETTFGMANKKDQVEIYLTGHSIGGVAAIFLGQALQAKKYTIKYALLLDAAFQKYVQPSDRDPKGDYSITHTEVTTDLMGNPGFTPQIGHNYFQDWEGTPKDVGIEETHGNVTPGFNNHNITTSVPEHDPHIGAIKFGFAEQYSVLHNLLKGSIKEGQEFCAPPIPPLFPLGF
jgi:hypothetical protein